MTAQIIRAIEAILLRGTDVEFLQRGKAISVLEVKKTIKYAPGELVPGDSSRS